MEKSLGLQQKVGWAGNQGEGRAQVERCPPSAFCGQKAEAQLVREACAGWEGEIGQPPNWFPPWEEGLGCSPIGTVPKWRNQRIFCKARRFFSFLKI